MSEIFREVDEDVRRDLYMTLWLRFRWLIIGAVVVVVGGTASVVGWRDYTATRQENRAQAFAAAAALADADRHDDAARAFGAFADDVGSDYAVLAWLREAAALAAAGDRAGAVATYDRVAADSGVDEVLREFAVILAAQHVLDGRDAAGAEQRLGPLAGGAGAWRHMARELQALAALQSGRNEDARAIFAELVEQAGVPNGVRIRASELLSALGGPIETTTQ